MAQYDNSAETRPGPGPALRKARNEAGRSLGELSAEMHVGVGHLESIEANNFESLGGRPYVKSYIRAYARCLELDPAPFIDAYEDLGLQDHKWKASDRLEPIEDSRQGVMFGIALVAGALLVALLFWLLSGSSVPEVEPMQDAAVIEGGQAQQKQAAEAMSFAPNSALLPITQNTQSGQWVSEVTADENAAVETGEASSAELVVPAPAEEQNAATEIDPVASPTESDEAAEESPQAESEPAAVAAVEESVEQQNTESEPEPEPESDDSSSSVQLVSSSRNVGEIGEGPDQISLELNENSWLEIQESNGNLLIRGLLNAGAVREISGTAPFQVFLGNAPGVGLRFNGKLFETESYTKSNNTARFALVRP